jgi:hypothetical protein
LGVRDLPGGGVGIPYYDDAGNELFVREREASRRPGKRFWQPAGLRLRPYGLQFLGAARKKGRALVVEGESDCWAAWHHDQPCLGVPGANAFGCLRPEDVEGLETLYAIREPDLGGEKFIPGLAGRLAAIGWAGKFYEVRLPVKDLADLHADDPDRFLARLQDALTSATLVPLPGGPRKGFQDNKDCQDGPEPTPPEWEPPVPLAELPEAPPFPLDVLPGRLRRFVEEAAAALECPPDYFAVPLLVMAGGAIGASRVLAVKRTHVQRACLYAAVIGPPGSLKSPALEIVTSPVHEAEEELHQHWKEAMTKYKDALEAYEQAKKDHKAGKGNGKMPEKPCKPVLVRLTVNDSTAEALVPILQDNPRGVVMVRDELTGWVLAMNQYREGGKGADQQFWLSTWSGANATVDRKSTHDLGPLRVRHPFVGVIGGLTPDKLTTPRGDRPRQRAEQDGFIDRVLMSYATPPRATVENWAEVGEEAIEGLRQSLGKLRALKMVPEQRGAEIVGWRPFLVKLSEPGRSVWQEFTAGHAAEVNDPDFPPHLVGPWSKLRGYAARLALVAHYLRWAEGEVDDDRADVDAESMARGVKLVNYFKGHARKVYAALEADQQTADARRVLRWLERHPEPEVFTLSFVQQGFRNHRTLGTTENVEA